MKRLSIHSTILVFLLVMSGGMISGVLAQSATIQSDLSAVCAGNTDLVVTLFNLDNSEDYWLRLERDNGGAPIRLDSVQLSSPMPSSETFTISPTTGWNGDDLVVFLIEIGSPDDTVDTDSKTISVSDPTSSITITASDEEICPGDNVTLSTTYSGVGTLKWYTTTSNDPIATGTSTTINTLSSPASYFARAVGNCDSTESNQIDISIIEDPDPVGNLTKDPNGDICPGDEVTLSVSGNTGNDERVVWATSAAFNSILKIGDVLDTSLTQTTTFFARRESEECPTLVSGSESIEVTVVPAPLSSIINEQGNKFPDPLIVCVGQTVAFYADTSQRKQNSVYGWSRTGDADISVSPSQGLAYFTFNQAEELDVRLTVDEGLSCSPRDVVSVLVLPEPNPNINLSAEEVCPGESATFSVNEQDEENYTWSYAGNTATGASVTDEFFSEGGISIIVLADNGACSASDTALLTVKPGPVAEILTDSGTIACSGVPLSLSALQMGSPPGTTFSWTGNGGANFSPNIGATTAVTYSNAGTFEVRLQAFAAGCEDRDTVEITVVENPDLLVNGDPIMDSMSVEVSELSTTMIELSSSLTGAEISWTMELDSGALANNFPSDGSGNIAETWELASGIDGAVVRVFVEVSFGDCSETYTFFLQVRRLLFIPDIISPNGDGFNETWEIELIDGGGALSDFSVEIFHRQGQCVYGCSELQTLEEATSRSWNDLADGPYFYIIRKSTDDDFLISGPVTLVR